MEEDRKFEDIVKTVMEDDTWSVPKEERDMALYGIAWALLDL